MKYLEKFYGTAFLSVIIFLAGFTLPVKAAGNHLDYSFNQNGKIFTPGDPNLGSKSAKAVAIQSDGKIVVVGTVSCSFPGPGCTSSFIVSRFNADGSPDMNFGSSGTASTNFGYKSFARAVVLQGDGKIVVIGFNRDQYLSEELAIARYNTNGTLDTTFDNDGRLTMAGLTGDAVAVQSNGKIIIVGKTSSNSFVVKRLNTNGSLDTTFGNNGQFELGIENGNVKQPAGVILQPDGKIVILISAVSVTSNNYDFFLIRLGANGGIDNFFVTDFGGDDEASGIKRMFDGRIVVTGTRTINGRTHIVLARYNTNGSLDTTFDADGKVITDLGSSSVANNLAVALNGEIVVAGSCQSGSTDLFTLVRYRVDGSRQTTFGTGGRVNTIFGSRNAAAYDAAIQLDNRIVAVGNYTDGRSDPVVARYNRQGIASTSDFSNDGQADFAVFRPSDGKWWVLNSATQAYSVTHWGQAGDVAVPGDYDGDGKTDAAIFRGGVWYILKSSDNNFIITQFGLADDKPVAGDYDGDSKTDIAVYRPSDGVWHLLLSTRGYLAFAFGISEDIPVPGDYDGDGLTDATVFRPSTGVWHFQRSVSGYSAVQFGVGGDIAVPADYDGDGFTDIAVWRPSNGVWYSINSQNNSVRIQQWGINGDIAAPADYDADGKADLTVFRPSNGVWYSYQSSTGAANILSWGQNGDLPIASRYSPQ